MKSLYYDKSIKSLVRPQTKQPRSIYDNKTNITYGTGQTEVRRLTNNEINPKTSQYTLHKVRPEEHQRPDLIAYKYYSNPILYSAILAYNNIYSPLDVVQGMDIKVPDIFSIYGSEGIITTGGVY